MRRAIKLSPFNWEKAGGSRTEKRTGRKRASNRPTPFEKTGTQIQ